MSASEELVRATLEAVASKDFERVYARLDPEIEWHPPGQGTLDDVYRGHDGVRRLFEQLFDAWASIVHEPIGFVDFGPKIVCVAHVRAAGRTSGVQLDELWGYVVAIDGELIKKVWMYTNPAAALEAARAPESA